MAKDGYKKQEENAPQDEQFTQVGLPEPLPPELPIVPAPGGAVLEDGEFRSPNYVKGQKGWKVDAEGNAEFQSLTLAGEFVEANIGTFGGDASDGSLNIAAGTTTIDLLGAAYVTKNYEDIIISTGATLNFSNPHTNGTVVILKAQGNIRIDGTIDISGMGGAGGAGGSGGLAGSDGSLGTGILASEANEGQGGFDNFGTAGIVLTTNRVFYTKTASDLNRRMMIIYAGSGGGGGESGQGAAPGGSGGRGGGGLLVECGGTLFFSGTINASGLDGSNGTNSVANNQTGGGGGGGGSCGSVIVLYNTLSVFAGTIVTDGGDGGDGGDCLSGSGDPNEGTGGGGAGSYTATGGSNSSLNAGGAGAGAGGADGQTTGGAGTVPGGNGGSSESGLVTQNKFFA